MKIFQSSCHYFKENNSKISKFSKIYKSSQVNRTIKSTDYNLSNEQINTFININESLIKEICDAISRLRYIKLLNKDEIDKDTFNELHPIMRYYYSPCFTKPDGNCMFHMISISLIGNDSLSELLRSLCIYTMMKYKNEFLKLLEFEENLQNNNNIDSIIKKYNQLLYEANTNKRWCNEYHLLAISTFLNSDIYIYSAFYNRNGQLNQPANKPEQLLAIFNDGTRTGAHLLYKPISNSSITPRNSKPIFGFFSSPRQHYISIIPHSQESLIFKPKNSALSI